MGGNGIMVEEADVAPDKRERPRLDDAEVRADLRDAAEARPDLNAGTAPAAERPKDYLEGFLSQKPAEISGEEPGGALYEAVIDALKDIYDPEIPVNIYDLGLVYNVEIAGGHTVVTMTLTTPNCPVAESMPGEVEMRVAAVPGVGSAEVNLIWDPPWDPQKMSDEAKLELGML